MDYRPQEVKAGLMIVISFLILIIFLLAISGLDLFKSEKYYLARFNYTSGLEVGSLVRFGGMEVGKIKAMNFYDQDDTQIEFMLEIDGSAPVKTNSVATVTSIGIMGEYHINISTGHPDSARLPSGGLLKCKEVPSLMQLMEPIGAIADQVTQTLSQLKQMLGKENQNEVHSILLNLNKLLAENQQTISLIMENLNNVIINLNKLGKNIDTLIASNEESISNSVKNLDETLLQTKQLMKNIDKMMIDLNNVVLTEGNNFNEIMENLRRTTDNLTEFSQTIKEQPWQLIRKSPPKDRKID